jgi:translation elongation factor P/translation initiation factor 5A
VLYVHLYAVFMNNEDYKQIDVPESLDISSLRTTGIQPGEQPMPESTNDTTITTSSSTQCKYIL